MSNRFDVVATITMTLADGRKLVDHKVLREDVTSTNGAYRAVRDSASEEIAEALKAMLTAHRDGSDVGSAYYLTYA